MDVLIVCMNGWFDQLTPLAQLGCGRFSESLTKENVMRRDIERAANRARRADHWVLLDSSWAQRLGVKRSGGVYRIRSRELFRRLAEECVGVDTSGQVVSLGTPGAARQAWAVQEQPRQSA